MVGVTKANGIVRISEKDMVYKFTRTAQFMKASGERICIRAMDDLQPVMEMFILVILNEVNNKVKDSSNN